MARSSVRAALLAALLVAASYAAPPDLQLDAGQPIQLDARSSDFDYKSSTLVFRGVKIAQGRLSIEADEAVANGIDFKASQWHFSGHVRTVVPDGVLLSDAATITFAANQIALAQITGTPATFEQKRPNGVARGRANAIEYRPSVGSVRLTGDAWLTDGSNEINGQTLIYDLPAQRIVASAEDQGGQTIHLTINPKKPETKPGGKGPAKSDSKPDSTGQPKPLGPSDAKPEPKPDAPSEPGSAA